MVSELSAPGLHWGIISRGIPLPASFLFSMTSTFILWSTISVTARTHIDRFHNESSHDCCEDVATRDFVDDRNLLHWTVFTTS